MTPDPISESFLESLLSHLGSLWGGALGVTFESLLGHFNPFWVSVELGERWLPNPKGPKIETIQDRPPGLNFSNEIENFKRATHQTPYFLWGFLKVGIEFFKPEF